MSGLCNQSLDLTGPTGDLNSPAHRLDPRAKTVGLIGVTLVAVSTPIGAWPVWAGCLALLAAYAAAAKVPAREIWRRARFILPVVIAAAVFLPFLRPGGEEHSLGPLTVYEAGLVVLAGVAAKATIGVISAVLLGATTPFPQLLRGLERMKAPRLFVLTAGMMYRYLFVVVEELSRMRAALASRAYSPRTMFQTAPAGGVASALFLRTHARAERVHRAMLSRGYGGGEMPTLEPLDFTRSDAVFTGGMLAALIALRLGVPALA